MSREGQPAGVEVAAFRQLGPIHHAGEEGHVAVVNLAGQRVLGGDIGKRLLADLAERLDQLVVEPDDLDAFVFFSHLTFSALNSASDRATSAWAAASISARSEAVSPSHSV